MMLGAVDRRRALAGLIAAALIGLAGCADLSGSSGTSGPAESNGSTSSAAPAPKPASAAELEKAKERAEIADCPPSDPDVMPRDDGLPDLTLDCLGGGRQVRLAGLRGTPMVINIWAQWCGPCRQEAPHLATLSQQAGDDLLFLGIDYQDPDPEAAIMFAEISDWHYPQLQDPQRELRPELGIVGIPTTLLVDADGAIVATLAAPMTSEDQLRSQIKKHLGVQL